MTKKSADLLPPVTICTPAQIDDDGLQVTSEIRMDGKEYLDPIPVAPPIGYNKPPELMDMIRTMIQSEHLRQELARQEFETFEEADDFEIDADPLDALTEYEQVFYPPPSPVPLKSDPPKPGSPEVLDTSVLGDTSPNKKPAESNSAKPADKAQ